MILSKLREDLIRDEGEVLHAYEDHLGFLTIGYGRLIDKRRGGGISKQEALFMLDNDILRVVGQLQEKTGFNEHPEAVQHALVNMGFQLGVNGLLGFKKMWAHLANREYEAAADEALNSRWAQQTPERAKRVTNMIRNGS